MTANDDNGRAYPVHQGFKRFAPGPDCVHVPVSSRKAALAGLAFYPACSSESVRHQKMAWALTRVLGPHMLPGRSDAWAPPMEPSVWRTLAARWRQASGDFDGFAVSNRYGAGGGLRVLLLRDGEPRAVAKLHPSISHRCGREELALSLMALSRPRSFRVPGILTAGVVEGWCYLLVRPLPPRIHRVPTQPPLGRIVAEIHTGLSGLPRPSDVPHHWYPIHGELAPWTLRELPDGSLVILDWDNVTWGPPGADEVFYRGAAAVVTGRHPGPIHVREAVEFWRRRILSGSVPDDRGPDFAEALLAAMDGMASR